MGLARRPAGPPWAYLAPCFHRYGSLTQTIRPPGLRVLSAGYQDTAGTTGFRCCEGDKVLAKFETCGSIGEVVEEYPEDMDFDDLCELTLFGGSRLPKDWIQRFESADDALGALAREFDAYVPYIAGRGT